MQINTKLSYIIDDSSKVAMPTENQQNNFRFQLKMHIHENHRSCSSHHPPRR